MNQRRSRLGVLVSGGGTNLQAILDAAARGVLGMDVAVVVSNRKKAFALERARGAGVPTAVLSHRRFDSREAFDEALAAVLQEHGVDWVALAGFMRLLTGAFLGAFPGRVLNIHPALLPAFPGLDAQQQALDYGARLAGCTVHIVDEGTDTGPIVAQAAVAVEDGDDAASLAARILAQEHRLYPAVLRWAAEGRVRCEGRKVVVEGVPATERGRFGPAKAADLPL